MTKKYQIGLSFAGEDRPFVDAVARALLAREVRVFYDTFEESELWGKNLYQHLVSVYRDHCEYVVIFISEHYAAKPWCKLELESAQARSFAELAEYILPVRFDDAAIPGLHDTTGYLDLRGRTPNALAEIVVKKLAKENLIPGPTRPEVSQDSLQHPIGFKLLYSANSVLSYRIAKRYYNDKHYVWCSPDFGSLAGTRSALQKNPPTSRPKYRYYRMLQEVMESDRHAVAITETRSGLLRGVEVQREAGRVSLATAEEILTVIRGAAMSDFRPLLYVIPVTSEILPRIKVVPVQHRAHPLSEEFIIPNLTSDEFDIVTLDKE